AATPTPSRVTAISTSVMGPSEVPPLAISATSVRTAPRPSVSFAPVPGPGRSGRAGAASTGAVSAVRSGQATSLGAAATRGDSSPAGEDTVEDADGAARSVQPAGAPAGDGLGKGPQAEENDKDEQRAGHVVAERRLGDTRPTGRDGLARDRHRRA